MGLDQTGKGMKVDNLPVISALCTDYLTTNHQDISYNLTSWQ
jgi:hypothetical protein